MHTDVTTKREARRRRRDALGVLGMTLADWRGLKLDYDCECCLLEDVRRMRVYSMPHEVGAMRLAALDEVRSMDWRLGEK